MTQSTLQACIECGRQVSRSAHTCPGCGKNPDGKTCFICKIRARESEVIICNYSLKPGDVHLDCFLRIFRIPEDLKCQDCGFSLAENAATEITPSNLRIAYLNACPNCGATRIFSDLGSPPECQECELPIFSFQPAWKDGRYHHECCKPKPPPIPAQPSVSPQAQTTDKGCLSLIVALVTIYLVVTGIAFFVK